MPLATTPWGDSTRFSKIQTGISHSSPVMALAPPPAPAEVGEVEVGLVVENKIWHTVDLIYLFVCILALFPVFACS